MRQSKLIKRPTLENIEQLFWDNNRQMRRDTLLSILNRSSGKLSLTGYKFTPDTQARFVRLITLAKQACSALALMSPLDEKTVLNGIDQRCATERAELNRILANVRLVPVISLATRGRELEVNYEPSVSRFDEIPEALAILALCDIITSDEVDRLRTCRACPIWYIAGREDKRTCSPKCRQKLLSSTPEFKRKRKKYLKDRDNGKFVVQPKKRGPKKGRRRNG